MGNKASHFSKTVDTLPGLTLDEKAKARVFYGTRPGFAEHADVFTSGDREVAARSIKLLVAEAAAVPSAEADAARQARGAARSTTRGQDLPTRLRKSKSFSSVNSSDVNTLMSSVNLTRVRGEALAPEDLQLPPDTPECSSLVCSGIPGGENAATPQLLRHHQQQLLKFGIKFDQQGGFEVYDTHDARKLLTFSCGEQTYTGGFDGCIAPYGLQKESAAQQCRIIYEHKLDVKGSKVGNQAILELLGAYAQSPCPVLLDVTNGQKHNIYTIRNTQLIIWEGLSPTQAYFMQAQHLKAHELRAVIDLKFEQIPEAEQASMRHVHQALSAPAAALQEQLDSVLPFVEPEERPRVAIQLIHAWAQAAFHAREDNAQEPAPRLPVAVPPYFS
ncbi:hypothetical protein HYH02_006820 [Chlamydomonas schloesseri]|uniref:Uncharacterized protein n=1 Tax=Chlamydomonas schloesseri TaxID=2026947 RepID=A0A836B5L7_9CHLO|nr:hypothetical protein HYH02_006820 [Chlamydomonas schloesseri]|eukprot:KAG2448235.1 hypothetical protein HYH02_006820 [Chlamydomonas schloesseri]